MPFDPRAYGEPVAQILALDANGERLIPLVCSTGRNEAARSELQGRTAGEVFPKAPHPKGALAGLWVYHSCFDEGHSIAQDDHSVEGSYWHAILHRQEPDAWNSGYWFRRVGRHPIFPALAAKVSELVDAAATAGASAHRMNNVFATNSGSWDPEAFIAFCESVRAQPGTPAHRLALEIQLAEWQLLFDFCARKKP